MQEVAWLEVTDEDWVLFIPALENWEGDAYENLGLGGIAYAEEWAETQDWELLGEWKTARRLDGSWETRVLIGQK